MKIGRVISVALVGAMLGVLAMRTAEAETAPFYNVMDYGAKNDGDTLCTEAIYKAIEACVAEGGGTVYFPAGKYLTGSIHMESNLTLFIDAGAELLYSSNPEDSPIVKTRWECTTAFVRSPLIYANGKENIAVVGRGTVNGQGKYWWDRTLKKKEEGHKSKEYYENWLQVKERIEAGEEATQEMFAVATKYLRPSLIMPYECTNVLIEGITLIDSPMWMLHPVFCENLNVRGISCISDGPNGDGIDVDSCRNVRISDCFFNTGDDCIVLKSGRDADGRRVARPTEYVTITNCTMYLGHGGVVIGSEMSGDVRNVTASNIVCIGTDRGIRVKSMRGRGGVVENLRFDNWIMQDIKKDAIRINSFYNPTPVEPLSERTPRFRNFAYSNITIINANQVASILGLPEMPIQGLRFTDIVASGKKGFVCSTAKDVEIHSVQVNVQEGNAFSFEKTTELVLDDVSSREPRDDAAVVSLRDCEDALVRGCRATEGTKTFLELIGKNAGEETTLMENHLKNAKTPVATRK